MLRGLPRCSVMAGLVAAACGDPGGELEMRPCEASVDCPVKDVCVDTVCEPAWSGFAYRLVGVSVSGCEGEYEFGASFDQASVAHADVWRECPASWSFEGQPMLPTLDRERFVVSVRLRYAGSPAATLEWEGIPPDVLHYGQWEGEVDGHRIGLWLEQVDGPGLGR